MMTEEKSNSGSNRPGFQVMAKPSGPACNLRCSYCFYLGKKDLFSSGDSFRMSDEVLETFIRQYIESQSAPEVQFAWQGGEPTLMGIDFFKKAVDLQDKYKRPGLKISNALQTNGTLLNEEWGVFLRENRFLVGLSLDGPPELHDRFRRDRGGRPSSSRVMRGLEVLKKSGVEFNLLCAVNSENAKYPAQVYQYLKDVGSGFIQFIPIIEPLSDGGVSTRSVTGEQYGRFLCDVFDAWLQKDVGEVFVQHFDLALEAWLGYPSSLCVFARTCGQALIIEHNGDIYSCDHYVFPEYRRGNIMHTHLAELANSPFQIKFGQDKSDQLATLCRGCEVLFACRGGCPKNRLGLSSDGEPLNFLCSGYRRFFNHIRKPMEMMAAALRSGHTAAAAALLFKAQKHSPAPGRNDPCPCGSGRKYKHCCLK